MTEPAQPPVPETSAPCVDAAAVHYGLIIELPPRTGFYIRQMRTPAPFKADVLVCFGPEAKTYTLDEFLCLLGFNNPPVGTQPIKTSGG